MRKLRRLLMAFLVFAVGTGVAAFAAARGTQSVLLLVPADFHDSELQTLLQEFVGNEADIYVASMNSADPAGSIGVDALTSRIPEHFFHLHPGLSGGPHVSVIGSEEALGRLFDKVLVVGRGWYDDYFAPGGQSEPVDPPYASGLYAFFQQALGNGTVIGAVGAGTYPVVFSGVLPPESTVAAYPCGDLIRTLRGRGHQPAIASSAKRADGSWPPVVTVEFSRVSVSGCTALFAPIPNSWYDNTDADGELLVTDYGVHYSNFVRSVEDAYEGR